MQIPIDDLVGDLLEGRHHDLYWEVVRDVGLLRYGHLATIVFPGQVMTHVKNSVYNPLLRHPSPAR